MEPYSQIVSQIIKDQEVIIGPIALEQAQKVNGLEIQNVNSIKINGDAKEVLTALVGQYSRLFGRAAIEVCKEAVHETKIQFAQDQLPEILK